LSDAKPAGRLCAKCNCSEPLTRRISAADNNLAGAEAGPLKILLSLVALTGSLTLLISDLSGRVVIYL
jgi:hypothetical protein